MSLDTSLAVRFSGTNAADNYGVVGTRNTFAVGWPSAAF